MSRSNKLILLMSLLVFSVVAMAQANIDLAVRGLMKNAVVVEINGQRRMLKVGKTSPEGVKLISSNSREAVFEVAGQRRTLGMSEHAGIRPTETASREIRIPRGNNGHFYATGLVNNRSANFIVDTGASTIAISEKDAKLLGIRYLGADRIPVDTASGTDLAYKVQLTSVTLGAITVYNIDAVILPGEYPQVILLGNTFLEKVDMDVDNGVLVLEARF